MARQNHATATRAHPTPQLKLGNVGHCCQGSVSPAQRHGALRFLEVCCSSCGKAMAGTSSNKYHLCHQQVQLVVGPNQHQPNRQPCHTRTCATTALVQAATWDQPDEVCLAGLLELQCSAVAGTKSCQNGPCPNPLRGRARKQIPGPNGIHLA